MSSYSKYLKYKTKYIELKKTYNGGGKASARIIFLNLHLEKNNAVFELFRTNLQNDITRENITVDIPITKENLEELFEIFYNKIKEILADNNLDVNKHIDFIVKSYLNNTFGEPSSLENIGRYIDSIEDYTNLIKRKRFHPPGFQIPTSNFNSLIALEEYLDRPDINKIVTLMNEAVEEEISGNMEPVLQTENVLVYNPQTIEQSKRYGKHTRWCTAAKSENMFDYYKKKGELYIFIGRKAPFSKFQVHFETKSLMDALDKPVTFEFMLSQFNNDEGLLHFLKQLILNKPELIMIPPNRNIDLIVDQNSFIETLPNYYEIVNELLHTRKDALSIELNINLPLENMLSGLINIKTLYLGYFFNKPLGDSLSHLTNLKTLILSYVFNKPLEDSLSQLTQIEKLYLGEIFNQPLDDSLSHLTNLKILMFSSFFNQPLGDSLSQLKSLKILSFGREFNQPLEDSLSQLINLEILSFGREFNQSLGDSLSKLINLKKLNLDKEYKHPIDKLLLPRGLEIEYSYEDEELSSSSSLFFSL